MLQGESQDVVYEQASKEYNKDCKERCASQNRLVSALPRWLDDFKHSEGSSGTMRGLTFRLFVSSTCPSEFSLIIPSCSRSKTLSPSDQRTQSLVKQDHNEHSLIAANSGRSFHPLQPSITLTPKDISLLTLCTTRPGQGTLSQSRRTT